MKIHVYLNDEYMYSNDNVHSSDDIDKELISFINDTLEWEYGDLDGWEDDITIERSYRVKLRHGVDVIKFIKKWNKEFGDIQKISFMIDHSC